MKKICEGFRATLYPCPDQAADRREMAVGVMQRLEDLNTVLGQTNDHRHRVLVAAAKNIKCWFVKVTLKKIFRQKASGLTQLGRFYFDSWLLIDKIVKFQVKIAKFLAKNRQVETKNSQISSKFGATIGNFRGK